MDTSNEKIILKKKRYKFSIAREKCLIESLIELPEDDEVVKIVSLGGFSSIGFVAFVAERAKIKEMTASTLRVGQSRGWRKGLRIL